MPKRALPPIPIWLVFVVLAISGCTALRHETKPPVSNGLTSANDPLLEGDPGLIWTNLQQSFLQLDPPRSWYTNPPAGPVLTDWKRRKADMALQMADAARDYYQRYPTVPEVARARESEYNLLEIVLNSGNTNVLSRLTALDKKKLANPSLNPQERFGLMAHIVERNANSHEAEGVPVVMAWLERGSRELLKKFPDNPQSWKFLVTVADQDQDPQKSQRLVNEIMASNAAEPLKTQALRIQGRLDHLGRPVEFKGTAVDGKTVDLSQLRGKVVALHFWDTGCGYCLAKMPEMQSIYDRLHDRGLEIVGISFDSDPHGLSQFLSRHPMPWPVCVAGPDWATTYGRAIDVQAIPTVWLIDRHGNLRDLNAREDLAVKAERLLNEH